MDPRTTELALAWTRLGIGVAALAAPRLAVRLWLGERDSRPTDRMLARSVGARDAALGIGILTALRRRRTTRGWQQAAALADTGDALAALVGGRGLPPLRRWFTVASAGGAAIAGALLAARADHGAS